LPVTARTRWRGRPIEVSGRLEPGFIVENGRVMVKLTRVAPLPEGADAAALWVPMTDVDAADPLLLRSHLWEIPAGQERDFLLRKLSITMAECIAAGGRRVQLAREMPGTTALLFVIDVPLDDGAGYLWNFAAAVSHLAGRPVPWQPPAPVTAAAELDEAARAGASHYASQLPLWLTTRQFWSAFVREGQRLVHVVQFSLPEKRHDALKRQFRLKDV
jgi:hypothetical protein